MYGGGGGVMGSVACVAISGIVPEMIFMFSPYRVRHFVHFVHFVHCMTYDRVKKVTKMTNLLENHYVPLVSGTFEDRHPDFLQPSGYFFVLCFPNLHFGRQRFVHFSPDSGELYFPTIRLES